MNLVKSIFVLYLFFFTINLFAKVDGTTGLPLGGIGTGALKFNAGNGTFSANFRTPTRNGDFQLLQDAQFQLFTKKGGTVAIVAKLTAQQNNGRVDDDAIFPMHSVNFGEQNGLSVTMTAYMPFNPQSVPDMCHPAAMFEFSLQNMSTELETVAVAFQIKTSSVPSAITDSGFVVKASDFELCLLGKILEKTGAITYGSNAEFFSTGLCNNQLSGTTNRVAIRVALSPVESKPTILRFVLAWYQPDEKEHYQYTNFWNDAKAVAVSALTSFDLFQGKAHELVNRMRSSNLPEWLTDQTLNSLANLVNNSVYLQDGRYCHTEGQWTPEGTMDQMWHSRQIYTMINPQLAWQELEWWARTQHVTNYTG